MSKVKEKTSYSYGSIRRQNNNLICNETSFPLNLITRICYILEYYSFLHSMGRNVPLSIQKKLTMGQKALQSKTSQMFSYYSYKQVLHNHLQEWRKPFKCFTSLQPRDGKQSIHRGCFSVACFKRNMLITPCV